MCGRYSMAASKDAIQQELPFVDVNGNVRISYNIAPTQHGYVVTSDSPNRLQYFIWGLIPHWSSDGRHGGKLINARSEGIATKPSFRLPIRSRRCLVIADSFYEWRKEGKQKIPYRIQMKDERLMVMAGIWDEWNNHGYTIKSFSILTTPPNAEMTSIHNRMPLFLKNTEERMHWLKSQPLNDVLSQLNTPEDDILKMYRVSGLLNSVKSNSPSLHKAVPETPTLF